MKKIILMTLFVLLALTGVAFADEGDDDFVELHDMKPYIITSDYDTPQYKIFVIKPVRNSIIYLMSEAADVQVFDGKAKPITQQKYISRDLEDPYNNLCFGGLKGHTYYVVSTLYPKSDDDCYIGSMSYFSSKYSKGGKSKAKAKKIKTKKQYRFYFPAGDRKPQWFKITTKKKYLSFVMGNAPFTGTMQYKITSKGWKGYKGYINDEWDGNSSINIKKKPKKKETFYIKVYPKNKYSSGAYWFTVYTRNRIKAR